MTIKLPKEIKELLEEYLCSEYGEGTILVQDLIIDDPYKSSALFKNIWKIFYQTSQNVYTSYLKTASRDLSKLHATESLITDIRLSQYGFVDWSAVIVKENEQIKNLAGSPIQLFLLEKDKGSKLLADTLRSLDDLEPQQIAQDVFNWLEKKHSPTSAPSDYYFRELIGGTYGILATVDFHSMDWFNQNLQEQFINYSLRWRTYLLSRPMVNIHGDFHPWNIFYDPLTRKIDVTGALHTPFGAPEDDWCCLAVNLALGAFEQNSNPNNFLSHPQWKILEMLERLYARNSIEWASGFFCGWRLMILANPRIFPNRSQEIREVLVKGSLWCLQDPERNRGGPLKLLTNIFSDNPWIKTLPTPITSDIPKQVELVTSSPENLLLIEEAVELARGKKYTRQDDTDQRHEDKISLEGSVQKIRRHGGVTFVELRSIDNIEDTTDIQAILQKNTLGNKYKIVLDQLQVFDRIIISGFPTLSHKGEPSIQVKGVEWLSHNSEDGNLANIFYEKAKIAHQISKIINTTRNTMSNFEFSEIWSPSVHNAFNGGLSHPFTTMRRHDNQECYLRVTMELLHKQLLAGGHTAIYEIGSSFRNESKDRHHLPEFLLLEAYATRKDLLWMEGVALEIIQQAWLATKQEHLPEVKVVYLRDILIEKFGIDLNQPNLSKRLIESLLEIKIQDSTEIALAIRKIIKSKLQHHLRGISLLRGIPAETTPLAKSGIGTRTWVHLEGVSVADICVEENNPQTVIHNINNQEEHVPILSHRDYRNFITSLRVGMPSSVGLGMSLSRVVQILTGLSDLRNTAWWEI